MARGAMDIFKGAERLMGMDGRVWSRHANPLSVYSRILAGPFLFFALWSIYWIGISGLGFIALAALWTWINPRLFPPPKNTDAWATKGVLGERVFLNRQAVPVPSGHKRAAYISTAFSAFFFFIAVYGFITRNFWAAFAGWHAAIVAKVWFVDRMVWLWEDVRATHPVYLAWDRADWAASFDDVRSPDDKTPQQ